MAAQIKNSLGGVGLGVELLGACLRVERSRLHVRQSALGTDGRLLPDRQSATNRSRSGFADRQRARNTGNGGVPKSRQAASQGGWRRSAGGVGRRLAILVDDL